MKLASRCWAHLSSDVDNGRDLFGRMNHAKIKDFSSTVEGSSAAGRYAKAWKILWDRADQVEWDRKAKEFVDIYA